MKIKANGIIAGPQEPLSELFQRLTENTLDPSYEECGNFYPGDGPEPYVWGSFGDLAYAFHITGTEAELEPIVVAIRANQASERYQARKAELAWLRVGGLAIQHARKESEREEALRRLESIARA